MPHRAASLAVFALLAACAPLPGVDALPPDPGGAFPVLVPLDDLLAAADAGAAVAPASLAARAARLRARAALMYGPNP